MLRLLLKLAIAALIANAAWRIGSAHLAFYKFKDAAAQAAQFGGGKTEDQLRQRVLELASQFDVPVTEDSFTIRREGDHTFVDGSYTKPIDVVPGYTYRWPFQWHVDVIVYERPK